jgi:hypothetical protein
MPLEIHLSSERVEVMSIEGDRLIVRFILGQVPYLVGSGESCKILYKFCKGYPRGAGTMLEVFLIVVFIT